MYYSIIDRNGQDDCGGIRQFGTKRPQIGRSRSDADVKNRFLKAENAAQTPVWFLYNAGMQKLEGDTREKRQGTLIGTTVLIGGFLCALLFSAVRIHDLHTPLSLGLLLGSQLAGFDPSGIVGGIIIGAFAKVHPYWQGMGTALLYWGTTRLVLLIRKRCSPNKRFLIFAVCSIAALPLSAIDGRKELLYGVISIAVSVLSAAVFRRICLTIKTMSNARIVTETEQGAIGLGFGMLLLAVSGITYRYWSLAVTLMLIATAVFVFSRGIFGAAVGILLSIMLTLFTDADPSLIGSVALGALAAAAVREKGKPFIIGAFFFSGILFQTYRAADADAMSASNLLGSMLLFSVIPKKWLLTLQRFTDPAPKTARMVANAIRRTEQRASLEVERMGKLLGSFSGMFHTHREEDDTIGRWTVQGALAICRGCEMRRLCWKNADAMREAIYTIAADASEGKRVTPIGPMDEYCKHFSDFCASVLLSYQQARDRNAVSLRANAQSGFVERQFSGAGAALCTFAKRMRTRSHTVDLKERKIVERLTGAGYAVESVDLYESEGMDSFSVRLRRPLRSGHSAVRREIEQACGYRLRCIRVAQSQQFVSFRFEQDAELHAAARISRTAQGGAVSGDATGECRIPGGRVCFALSDGMGSGKEARRESEAAIRLLFRLYHAGVEKELVYENVNRMLLAQSETEMYATLDAISIDLNTGVAEILKYGAPPSYLLRDGVISTISGQALPCGILAEAKPSVIRLQLRKDDRIVLCSDGVQDVLPEGVEQAIRTIDPPAPETGDRLLQLAQARGGTDDMTVMVIRVA